MTFGAFATLLVSLAFAGLFYWVLNPRNKARLQSYASIPLDDDDARKPPPREQRRPDSDRQTKPSDELRREESRP
ncbi:MAG TPA: cbb3-type cytochrome c oxidase subunit 3 [Pseudomonadales bacterium]|nr:cbb3-type cytochrome c oxidase subunit 3 [Pseudomonadales bacterium]